MKKKVPEFKEIQDKNLRSIVFNKRKRGIIKKGVELSMLCSLDIMMAIYNKENNKLVIYQSSQDFNVETVTNLLKDESTLNNLYEEHTNFDLTCAGEKKSQTFKQRLAVDNYK